MERIERISQQNSAVPPSITAFFIIIRCEIPTFIKIIFPILARNASVFKKYDSTEFKLQRIRVDFDQNIKES